MALQDETRVPPQFLPLSIVRAIWKRKLLLLVAWAIVSAATVVVVWRLPAVYRAQSLVLIEGQRVPERFVPTTVDDEVSNRLSMLAQQIKSYTALMQTIGALDLYKEERKTMVEEEIINKMRSDIDVQLVQGWGRDTHPAFTISYQSSNPVLAARVAEALTTKFQDQNLKMRGEQARGTQQFLDNQLEEARRDLEKQEAKLSEFRQQYHGELPTQASALLSKLTRLETQLKGVQDSVRSAEQQKMLLNNARASAQSSLATFRELAKQPQEIARMEGKTAQPTELDKARQSLASLELRYSDDHPDVVRTRVLVQRLEKAEAAASEATATETAAKAAESAAAGTEALPEPTSLSSATLAQSLQEHEDRIRSIDVQMNILDADIAGREKEKQQILAEMASTQSRVEALPSVEQKQAIVIRDYDISRENYRDLLDKKKAADLAYDLESLQKGERLVVLDMPRVPSKPIKPNREMLAAMGCGGGLVLGMLLAFGLELRRGCLLGEWELPEGSTVLGRIPPVKLSVAKRKKRLSSDKPKRSKWPRSRIVLRLRPPRKKIVLAPTILLCVLVVIVATSIYAGWSPF